MIVDDDPNIVKYLTTLFEDNGYETCTANDGTTAMKVLEAEKPDLITLDLDMPNEWGTRFYRKYSQKDEFKDLPVIVVSGLSSIQYSVKNAVAFFNKPFDRDELLNTVKGAIG